MNQAMTNKPPGNQPPQAGGLNLHEVYYVIFRHKWLILLFSLGGLAAAVALHFLLPKFYQSDTKLLVKYVVENRNIESPSPGSGDQVRTPDAAGASILNSEIAILTSFDVMKRVAEAIDPEKILPKGSSDPNSTAAAFYISANLTATATRYGSVIDVVVRHPDPQIPQTLLKALVEAYLSKHVDIHRAAGTLGNHLSQQRDKSRAELTEIEEAMRNLKNKVGVASVEDSRRSLLDQVSRVQQQLLTCEADLAERQAALKESQVGAGIMPATNEVVVRQEVPPAKMEEYRRLAARLEGLRNREQDLLVQFTEGNILVKKIHQLVVEAETTKSQMEEEFPALRQVSIPSAVNPERTGHLATDAVPHTALQARRDVLRNQLEQLQTNLLAIQFVEPEINRLQARRDQEEAILRGYQARMDRVLASSSTGAGNIAVIQEASPARPAASKRTQMIGGALAGGISGGIGLAFLIELMLRQSIRHSTQVEKKLGLPLFISIPKFGRKGFFRTRNARRTESPQRDGVGVVGVAASDAGSAQNSGDLVETRSLGGAGLAVEEWEGSHQLRSYYDALRDRLVTFFEVRNMTHKPKLVAVTGCSKGAGVSSVAAGLAAALSETGDGNVLLVDMNIEHGVVHPFFRGKPAMGISDALDAGERQLAHVQEKLYAASASVADNVLEKALPKRFASLVPRFKASDYDYIIFDMPSVTQTSLTPRLTGYMDMVLLVLEAEKTNLGVAGQAVDLLRESRANVGAVINGKSKFVPAWLLDEF